MGFDIKVLRKSTKRKLWCHLDLAFDYFRKIFVFLPLAVLVKLVKAFLEMVLGDVKI